MLKRSPETRFLERSQKKIIAADDLLRDSFQLAAQIHEAGFHPDFLVGLRRGGESEESVVADIAGVTRSLGVAFNSTFIALLISIVLMFLLHQLQLHQERLVLETGTYLDEHLIRHLQVGEKKGLGA